MVDLKAHAADTSLPHSSLAQAFVDIYEFPVLMIVALSDGTIVHKMNANDFLDMEMKVVNLGFSDPSSQNYYKFLMEGIEKAETILQQKH
ncbi:selenoprotein n-like [Plakobranchus ocellatus]|uniref:Selenoprotein n-like n=1 Tax=Plakobranchus ocellatus TaxID=259542 RepID=A0AAV3YK83_9GAST|nr:selenoprotein n-like [Plakobranchus ocellatus]